LYKQGDRVVHCNGKEAIVGNIVEILDKELAEEFGHPVEYNISVLKDCRRIKKGKFWLYEAIDVDFEDAVFWCRPQDIKPCSGKAGMKERRSNALSLKGGN
jgi:hypothetical protein